MEGERANRLGDGLSRRQLLARGAIAGGLVWAAPVIRTTAAYATTENGTERPCASPFYMVVINPAGQAHPPPGNTQAGSIPPAIRQWFRDNPDVPVDFPTVAPQLTQTGGDAWAVLLPEVTGPNASARQCRMVLGWARQGNDYKEGYVDPNPPIAVEVGRRLLFPCARVRNNPDATSSGVASSDLGAAGSISTDGAGSAGLGTDGSTRAPIGSDGATSGNGNGNGNGNGGGGGNDGEVGNGACIDAIYLVYCCPR